MAVEQTETAGAEGSEMEREREAGREHEPELEAEEASGGGLEQVREILVEPRAQELERSIAALDRRKAGEIAALRREIERNLERLGAFAKNESGVLSDRLASERRERAAAHADLHEDMREGFRRLEQRVAALEESVSNGERELRQRILDQNKEVTDQLHRWREEMAAAIARDLAGLRTEKADRNVLARLLGEISKRLTETTEPVEIH